MLTNEQLSTLVAPTGKVNDQLVAALNETFARYHINTPLRICHFLAQILHESGTFRYSTEIWGNTPAQQKYDTRVDLGNSPEADGDGYKYRGRGWIQLTGRANYLSLTKEFGVDFVSEPDLVAREPYNALSAGWFWNKRGLSLLADADDVRAITKKINGGYNGLDDRIKWLNKAKSILLSVA
jgi:putative chitinase